MLGQALIPKLGKLNNTIGALQKDQYFVMCKKQINRNKKTWRSKGVELEEAGNIERNFCLGVLGHNPEFIPHPPVGYVPLTVLFKFWKP